MPRTEYNDGQEIIYEDLSDDTARLEMELYDRVIYELMGRQQNLFFGDGFLVGYVNTTTVSVNKGNGVYYDSTQSDPEPNTRLFYNKASQNLTITTPDGTHDRIDLVCAKADRAVIATASRNQKDATTGVVSSVTLNVETDWQSTLQIVAGTPASSPVAPSVPTGYVAIAQLYVTSVTGMASASAITDKRARYRRQNQGATQTITTSTYVVDLDDNIIKANCNANAITLTLPAASAAAGREYQFIRVDSTTANTLTVAAAGSDTINGLPSTTIDQQYSTLKLVSDGSSWYII